MPVLMQLRSANSGAPFVGANDLDTMLWDDTAKAWYVGPGGGGGAVTSVFGRVGAVVAATGDYDSDQVDNVSSVAGVSVSDALETLAASAGAVTSVFGRVGVVVAATGDYDSDQVDNVSGVSGSSVSDALDTLDAPISLTGSRVTAGPAGTFLAGGVTNSWQTLFTAPTNPADDGKVVLASGGNFTYLGGTAAGQALIWTGTAWGAGVNFSAQNLTTTGGFVGNSGSAFARFGLVAGSGAGVASAAATGNIRGARGAGGFTANVRNNGDTADLVVIKTDTVDAVPYVQIGDYLAGGLSAAVLAPATGIAKLGVGASISLQLNATSLSLAGVDVMQFSADVVNPRFSQNINGLSSGVGNKLSLFAQACTGPTSTGGALDVGPGRGSTAGGLARLVGDDSTKPQRFAWNMTGISFFTTAPIAQQTVTGSRATGAALADLLTKLALTGLLVDGSVA